MGIDFYADDFDFTKIHRLHVLALDLRTKTMLMSKYNESGSEYVFIHNGSKKSLGIFPPSTPGTDLGLIASSRFGYTSSGENLLFATTYYDADAGQLKGSAPVRNPRLGQYEGYPSNIRSTTVAKIPSSIGLAVSANKDALVSFDLPDGTTVNYHSGAPSGNFEDLISKNLSGLTVNPVSVR